MTMDKWQEIEEKAKTHEQGSNTWLKLINDGDRTVIVFLGEPYPREVVFVDGKYVPFDDGLKAQGFKPSLRVSLNVALLDTKEVKVFEQGVTFFKDLVRVKDKYGLENWAFEIERHGAAKDPKTTYSILPDQQLRPDQKLAFEALQLHDLEALYRRLDSTVQEAPIDPRLAQSLTETLKKLPREAVERFCKNFSVQRIKDLNASQADMAELFVDALVTEYGFDPFQDPFA